MTTLAKFPTAMLAAALLALAAGCSSMKTPATADVAVSGAAVDTATKAGAAEYAPVELNSARDKLALARQAMDLKDYKNAADLAAQAQADAQLAQSKADDAKAQAAAAAVQDSIRVLREELARSDNNK